MQSKATSPAEYMAALPAERLHAMKRLRQTLRKHLPKGFQETVDYGMLAYVVPHKLYPAGYHCAPDRPLPFINLANQKHYISLYHMGLYQGALLTWLEKQWPRHTSAKLDLGRCCLRLKTLDTIPYELIGDLAARITPQQWIEHYENSRRS